MKCYAFLGIQGSGKGTQAEKISEYLNYQHINIGDLFRYHIKNGTPMGKKVSQIISSGALVPDETVFELVSKSTHNDAQGIIFDGFPRTIPQAEYLLEHYSLQQVFYLELTEETAIGRISQRRVCSGCGANYNLASQPPSVAGICDACGNHLTLRQDDQPEAISKRFAEFYEQTFPLRQFYLEHQLLTVLSADASIEEIFGRITDTISAL
jgi:adenylate kinase